MGVLAVFDDEGNWAQTHVCDGLIQENLARIGASWGRWNVHAPWPAGGELATLLDSRREELRQLDARFGTGSVTRVRLDADEVDVSGAAELVDGLDARALRSEWRQAQSRDSLAVHWVLEGIQVIYLRSGTGHFGVLCEAGEWLAVPAGVPHARDAGETPNLDLLLLSQGDEASPSMTHAEAKDALAVAALPSLDVFVETMLELTGNEAD